MPKVGCPFPDCTYETSEAEAAVIAAELNIHALVHQRAAQHTDGIVRPKPPSMERPTVSRESTAEEWQMFTRKWELFKQGTDIPRGQITNHLWQCCEAGLAADLFKQIEDMSQVSENTLLDTIKCLAVVNVATSVRKTRLLSCKQDRDQPIRSFAASVKGTARICGFSIPCPREECGQIVDYTDDIVKHVVISGIGDDDIRRDVLSLPELDDKSLADTIALIETKEMACRAMSSMSPRSHLFVTKVASNLSPVHDTKLQAQLDTVIKCESCGKNMKKFKLFKGRFNKTPTLREFSQCLGCWKSKKSPHPDRHGKTTLESGVACISRSTPTSNCINKDNRRDASVQLNRIPLDHHIFDGTNGWMVKESSAQPTVALKVWTTASDYSHICVPCPKMSRKPVQAITDTGAQSSLMGLSVLLECGLTVDCLQPVKKRMYAANEEGINILGAVLLRLSGRSIQGNHIETAEMVYVTDSTKFFYLSRHAMEQLRIIGSDFPQIGVAAFAVRSSSSPSGTHLPCECPKRVLPPERPTELPFKPCIENNEKMKQWLFERYASSTFNKCKHQMLPAMSGPPIAVHIDPDARPTAVHTPAPVPIHWRDEVKQQLDADVRLGVIEKVEPNTPTTWCHRAIWVRKGDGSPRRVVDFQSLNRHCSRDTHHIIPPFQQARSIPPGTFRSVTDAWNGYHSVPVRECDRHLLTFITEFGRYRYRVAPQGFIASGDGYTHRYDQIIADIPRKTKCVDDTVLWDENLTDHWWRMIDYLELMGREGIVLNPSKFQFASSHIEFAGFEITADDVRPLPKYLEAITCFPRPKSISDIRSWFGLVNQVSHYGKLTNIMIPFKSLLSPKTPFTWTKELDEAFSRSKAELIEAIKDGVRIFDPRRQTCLNPDWSKTGIGYWLRQKYCDCESATPDCCSDGWKITLAGSRFLRTAEQRYAPIEGEALAVAWSLEDTKFFTLGCDDLVIATDHKPLVKIFGDRSLDDISNTRIFRLKQRTMSWRFRTVHVPGKSIPASDAFSRHPASPAPATSEWLALDSSDCVVAGHDDTSHIEPCIVAATKASLNAIKVTSWDELRSATICDKLLTGLKGYILSGFPDDSDSMPLPLQSYWRFRDKLSIVDDVVMYEDRVVVPLTLREAICEVLHSAHQGVTAMSQRAQATVFWPGITACIQRTRSQCDACCRSAPSQPHLPPVTPFVPTYPFQAIAIDYCTIAGNHYLVVVDRFSNWPAIFHIRPGSHTSGAEGLQDTLRTYFSTYGVAEELSSDGGPEFTAYSTKDFLKRWGVRHRLSSAYNARSNGRAEIAVKSMKRLLSGNVSQDGSLLTDSFVRAVLQFRNCPDPDSGLSPAQVIFGRPLKDALPFSLRSSIFTGRKLRPMWKKLWEMREQTLRTRFSKQIDSLTAKTKCLLPLNEGDICRVQNQHGRYPLRWDRTGMVVQCRGMDQYLVKIDGSGRLSLRNRKYLRKVEPFYRYVMGQPSVADIPSPPPETLVTPQLSNTESLSPARPDSQDAGDTAEDVREVPDVDEDIPIATTDSLITHSAPRRSARIKRTPVWHKDYAIGTLTFR